MTPIIPCEWVRRIIHHARHARRHTKNHGHRPVGRHTGASHAPAAPAAPPTTIYKLVCQGTGKALRTAALGGGIAAGALAPSSGVAPVQATPSPGYGAVGGYPAGGLPGMGFPWGPLFGSSLGPTDTMLPTDIALPPGIVDTLPPAFTPPDSMPPDLPVGPTQHVPEPAGLLVIAAGLLGLCGVKRP